MLDTQQAGKASQTFPITCSHFPCDTNRKIQTCAHNQSEVLALESEVAEQQP